MKKLLKILLGLFSTTSSAQVEIQKTPIVNNLFDQVVLNDESYKVSIVEKIPEFKQVENSIISELKYEKGKRVYNLKELFDSNKYSYNSKIEYLKNAIADDSINALEYIGNNQIEFIKDSKDSQALIDSYFDDMNYESSDDIYVKFKRLEYQTKNLLDNTYNLIIEYFKSRPELQDRYHNEADLIYRLVKLGKEKEALSYMKILIDDYIIGDIKGLQLGSRNDQMHTGYVFDILCFSEDQEIRHEATDQLFYLLENKDYNTYELYQLTSFIDKQRHIKLLEKRFEHFRNIDFSPIRNFKTDGEANKNRRKLVPEANAFFAFMYTNSFHLGESKGKEIWQKFTETMPYWEIHGQPFEMSQMYILENCFKDEALTQDDKIEILKSVRKSKRFYNDRDYHGSYKSRFLNLIVNTFPDKYLSEELYNELEIDGFVLYSNPLNITDSDLLVHPFRKQIDLNEINNITAILNNYASNNQIENIQLNEQKKFYYSLKTHESIVFDFFYKNQLMSWFDAESSVVPTNYSKFHDDEFSDILITNGIESPEIKCQIEKIESDQYAYETYVSFVNRNYLHKYQEYGTDWYTPQRLVKILNLELIGIESDKRLIAVDSGDQTAMFILGNPLEIKELLSNFDIRCWAIDMGDDFCNN